MSGIAGRTSRTRARSLHPSLVVGAAAAAYRLETENCRMQNLIINKIGKFDRRFPFGPVIEYSVYRQTSTPSIVHAAFVVDEARFS